MPPLVVATLIWGISLIVSVALGWLFSSAVLYFARVRPSPQRYVHSNGKDIPVLNEAPDHEATSHEDYGEVLRGGTWIGILERLAITTCILSGNAVLIAGVIAVKGLGRYPELKDNPGAAERFLIGTGTSMLTATWVGLAGLALMVHYVP